MKASELRIGNLINSFDRRLMVTVYELTVILNCKQLPEYAYTPIALTEEWMVKFGFPNNGYKTHPKLNGRFYPHSDTHFNGYVYYSGDDFDQPAIQYVHQLQNLYFALTGEELQIK